LFVIYFVDLPRVPAWILQGRKLRTSVGQVKSGVTIAISASYITSVRQELYSVANRSL